MDLRVGVLAIAVLSFAVPGTLLPAPHAGAQSARLRRAAPPREGVRLDAATGAYTRGPIASDRSAATVSDFPNLDLVGFAGIDSGGGLIEWFNDGVKGTSGNASDLVTTFVVAYATVERDVSLGGPGATAKLGFYEGYTRHGGPNGMPDGTAVAVFTLTGLPGHTASSSFWSASSSSYLLELELPRMTSFADGPIGYAWEFLDSGTDGVLCGTAPLLAHAGSCIADPSGAFPGPPDALGQVAYDSTTRGRPADLYVHGMLPPFFPGDLCTPFSMAVDVREARDVTATAAAFTGDGVNADVLAPTPAVVGGSWSPQVTLGHGHGSGGSVLLNVRTSAVNGPSFVSPIGGRTTEVLIAGPLLATLSLAHDGAATLPASVGVPPVLALVCVPWAAQATVAGGGFVDLSTAVSGVTGTQ